MSHSYLEFFTHAWVHRHDERIKEDYAINDRTYIHLIHMYGWYDNFFIAI